MDRASHREVYRFLDHSCYKLFRETAASEVKQDRVKDKGEFLRGFLRGVETARNKILPGIIKNAGDTDAAIAKLKEEKATLPEEVDDFERGGVSGINTAFDLAIILLEKFKPLEVVQEVFSDASLFNLTKVRNNLRVIAGEGKYTAEF